MAQRDMNGAKESWPVTGSDVAVRPVRGAMPADPGTLDRTLALAWRLVSANEAFAAQLAGSPLDNLDLPPVAGSATDQAHLQVVAPLYLASELEEARLLPAFEMLAGLYASGGVQADLGASGAALEHFWRSRHERIAPEERRAFFARLFGAGAGPALAMAGARNDEFENLMIDLCSALYRLDPAPAVALLPPSLRMPPSQAGLMLAADRLAANLIPRSGGMASYAARDILQTTQDALNILKQPAVQQAVFAHSVWSAVQNITRSYLQEEVDVPTHVDRGRSGTQVLAWLAEVLPLAGGDAGQLVPQGHPVIGAATVWLEASLTVHEHDAQPAAQRSG